MDRIFKRQLDNLGKITEFVEESFTTYGIDSSFLYQANFVIEELFTNMVKYSNSSNDEISISLEKKQDSLIIVLIDKDVEAFDPRTTKDVDTLKPAQDRLVGGLGTYLVRRIAKELDYEYANRQSKITVTLSLEKNNV